MTDDESGVYALEWSSSVPCILNSYLGLWAKSHGRAAVSRRNNSADGSRRLLGWCYLPWWDLIRILAIFFSGALLSQSLLHTASLARFQIVGVTLDFLDNVFRLNLAFEATEGVLQ